MQYLLLLLLLFTGCLSENQRKSTSGQTPTSGSGTTVLRLHGSNTLGAVLIPGMVEQWLLSRGAQHLETIAGTVHEEMTLAYTLQGRRESVEIHRYGSSTAFTSLLSGKADVGLSSRAVRENEVQHLIALGDMKSQACEHTIALDGIALVTATSNPVTALTIEQIRKIFVGKITRWEELHPTFQGPIQLWRRDNNSGTHETFNMLVMNGSPIHSSAGVCIENEELSESVASDPFAIGYTSVTFTGDNRALSLLGAGNTLLEASKLAVQSEEYPLSRRLFLYTSESSENSLVGDFIEFAHSREGQKVVEDVGFISLTPKLIKPRMSTDMPRTYRDEVENAFRFSIVFRFQPGSMLLDSRAQRDILRLSRFLNEENLHGYSLKCIGFSDALGDPRINRRLSHRRAQTVAEALAYETHLPITFIGGFGEILPVAPNNTPEGREKNRRVEVWISRTL